MELTPEGKLEDPILFPWLECTTSTSPSCELLLNLQIPVQMSFPPGSSLTVPSPLITFISFCCHALLCAVFQSDYHMLEYYLFLWKYS